MESVDKNRICRLCLLGADDLTSIFEVNVVNGLIAADLIKDLLQFQVCMNDGYPHLVCPICLSKLNEFRHFKQQCQTSKITYDNVFSLSVKSSDITSRIKTDVEPFDSDLHHSVDNIESEFGVVKSEREDVSVSEEQLNYESENSERVGQYTGDTSNQTELMAVKKEPPDTSTEEDQVQSNTHPVVVKDEPEEEEEDMSYELVTMDDCSNCIISENSEKGQVRRRRCITVDEKLLIFKALDDGMKKAEIARSFGLPPSTLTTILKKRLETEELARTWSCRRKWRCPKNSVLDQKVFEWLTKERTANRKVGGKDVQKKARELAYRMGIEGFYASNGWLDKFKDRWKIGSLNARVG